QPLIVIDMRARVVGERGMRERLAQERDIPELVANRGLQIRFGTGFLDGHGRVHVWVPADPAATGSGSAFASGSLAGVEDGSRVPGAASAGGFKPCSSNWATWCCTESSWSSCKSGSGIVNRSP